MPITHHNPQYPQTYTPLIIKLTPFQMAEQYQRMMQESRQLATRMRNGTGAASLLQAENAPTHHMDALQRFQKDFAQYQRQRRQQEKMRRQQELQRKRVEILDRENNRWQAVQNYQQRLKERQETNAARQRLGIKRTANSNGLAYNPITLEYDRNPQGERLKRLDEDTKIRGYVRAHNMDKHGNSNYNILNGQDRLGVQRIIPKELNDRYQQRKFQHYDNLRLKVPSTADTSPYSRYY